MRLAFFLFKISITAIFISNLIATSANANGDLRQKIIKLDLEFFDAFNTCNLSKWRKYLSEDIEFYQDNDDVTTTRKELEPSFLDRCGPDNTAKLQRELIEETVEVHPIQGYGAVQMGSHHFWTAENNERIKVVAKPKFVHLWRNRNGVWQITRVISYSH